MTKPTKLILLSQVAFLVLVGICVAILPHFLFAGNEGGMSNYGVHTTTVAFYTLAFVLSAALLLCAARELPATKDYRPIKTIFAVTACSLLLVLVTTYPYQHNNTFGNIHTAANILTFCFEMLAGGWIALVFHRSLASILLLLLQLAAFVLLILTFIGTIHLLFVAQILTLVAFGLLLVIGTTTT